jgi:hypothetical protein
VGKGKGILCGSEDERERQRERYRVQHGAAPYRNVILMRKVQPSLMVMAALLALIASRSPVRSSSSSWPSLDMKVIFSTMTWRGSLESGTQRGEGFSRGWHGMCSMIQEAFLKTIFPTNLR